jgi:hypothetical protein
MDFLLTKKKATIAPRAARDMTIPATAPPPTFLLPPSVPPTLPPLLPLGRLLLLLVEGLLLLSLGLPVEDGSGGGAVCDVGAGGGKGLLLKEFPSVLQ